MKGVLRTGVGRGEGAEEGGERREGKMGILQISHFWSKRGPGKIFWGIEGCRVDENEVPERLGHLPGPETFENGRKMRFWLDFDFLPGK